MPSLNTILFLSENGFHSVENARGYYVREDPIFGNVYWISDRGCASFFQWLRPCERRFEDYTFSVDGLENAYARIDRVRLAYLRDGGPRLKKGERDWLLERGFQELEPQENSDEEYLYFFQRRGVSLFLRPRGWGYLLKSQAQRKKEEKYEPTPMVDDRHFATLHDLVVTLEWMDVL